MLTIFKSHFFSTEQVGKKYYAVYILLLNTDHLHWGHFHGYHNACIYELYVTERCYVGSRSPAQT